MKGKMYEEMTDEKREMAMKNLHRIFQLFEEINDQMDDAFRSQILNEFIKGHDDCYSSMLNLLQDYKR